jgi:hypothetical protein
MAQLAVNTIYMKIADRKIEVYIGVYKGRVNSIINPTSRMIL